MSNFLVLFAISLLTMGQIQAQTPQDFYGLWAYDWEKAKTTLPQIQNLEEEYQLGSQQIQQALDQALLQGDSLAIQDYQNQLQTLNRLYEQSLQALKQNFSSLKLEFAPQNLVLVSNQERNNQSATWQLNPPNLTLEIENETYQFQILKLQADYLHLKEINASEMQLLFRRIKD